MGKVKEIGKKNSPDITKSLKKFIQSEEIRELNEIEQYGKRFRQFYENEWDDEDYGYDFTGTKPWWADYGVESSLECDEQNYLDQDDDDDDDDFDAEYYKNHKNDLKQIYYYEDINDKWGRQEFHTLKDFNNFCSEMGILMTNETANNLIYNFETHCCLNPEDKEDGNLVLVDDTSYGGLTWTVGMDEEDFAEVNQNNNTKHLRL